ncbi:MAG: HINT domain-containing protein [Bacteroidales bacterium]|nr:HINT domain-containing protein [Bacteroidales bacterium]
MTLLRTQGGLQAIETLKVGDRVLSRDEHDRSSVNDYKVVEEVFERLGRVWHLTAGGRLIRTTGEHPFQEVTKGWIACFQLAAGDRLVCEDGSTVLVEAVVDTGAVEVVYNLRVADWHTYFVGGEDWGFSVWAHNAYLGLSNPAVRVQGDGYATLASGWWETLPDGNRRGATVAVTMIGTTRYVALYANIGDGPRQFTQEQVNDFMADATAAGWVPIHTSGNIHAEMAIHMQYPNVAVIGISNPTGPCDSICRNYFTHHNYYNIVWPGSLRATWGI